MAYFPLKDTSPFPCFTFLPLVQEVVDTILVIQHACGFFSGKWYERCLLIKFMNVSPLEITKKLLKSLLFISDCYLVFPQSLTTLIHVSISSFSYKQKLIFHK